jgi:hypothetical protein
VTPGTALAHQVDGYAGEKARDEEGIGVNQRIQTFVMAGAIALLTPLGAMAQEATPAASDLFADLGLPELTVTYTDSGLQVDQSEIPAGRYHVHFVSESGNPNAAAGFVRLPEGKTLDDLSWADEMAAGTPIPAMGPDQSAFAWLYETYVTGGGSVDSPDVVVDLPPGDYGVWPDDPTSPTPAPGLTVTGDAATPIAAVEPEAAVTVIEQGTGGQGFTFQIDGEIKSGPQIVKIVNASDQPHFVIVGQYPEPITMDQLQGWLMFDPSTGATPAPNMIDDSKVTTAGYAAAQSAGTVQWVVMNFTPGQAFLVCFVPDPLANGVPHAFEGMVELVDVAS